MPGWEMQWNCLLPSFQISQSKASNSTLACQVNTLMVRCFPMEKKAVQSSEDITPFPTKRTQKQNLYTPNYWDLEKLRAFLECCFFTAEQLTLYLGLSLQSRTMMQEKLNLLSGHDKKLPCAPYLLRMVKPDYR